MIDVPVSFADPIPWWETSARLLAAALCAAPLGWDREAKGRSAGLRTYMLVSVGAAGFALLSLHLALDETWGDRVDPSRIIASIVGGIGFLGAGAIIQSGGAVRGLTTAAGLWVAAAIGTAMGLGAILIGLGLTVLGILIMTALHSAQVATGQKAPDTDD